MIALALVAIIFHLAFADDFGPEYLDMLRATGRDEEFAKLMGISDPSIVRPSDNERSDNELLMKFGGKPVSELGDILLTDSQREQARQGILFNKYGGSKWSNKVIPYAISTTDFTADQRATIESALQKLNDSMTKLKLRKYTSEPDYVFVFSGSGCYSNLGRTGGKQPLSLNAEWCLSTNGTIQHEFIHAAGFLHEHMRPDRDSYVKVLAENIPASWQPQYEKASSNDFGNQGTYNYYSVMHYPMEAAETGRPAFEVFDKTIHTEYIGQRIGITFEDMRKVDQLYA